MKRNILIPIALAAALFASGAQAVVETATITAGYIEEYGTFLFFNNTTSFDIDDVQLLSVGGLYPGESLDFGPVASTQPSAILFFGPPASAFAADYDDNVPINNNETVYQFAATYKGKVFLSSPFSPSDNESHGYVDFLGLKYDVDLDPVQVSSLKISATHKGGKGGKGGGGSGGSGGGGGSAVPEPAAWTMMVLGFGALGGAARRRRAAPGQSASPAV